MKPQYNRDKDFRAHGVTCMLHDQNQDESKEAGKGRFKTSAIFLYTVFTSNKAIVLGGNALASLRLLPDHCPVDHHDIVS